MPVDVLFVGGGPACLAGSLHLVNLVEAHNLAVAAGEREGEALEEPMIALIEKGSEIGAHGISGAVLDTRALEELVPDFRDRDDFPVERWVEKESLYYLTKTGGFKAPLMPAELHDTGLPILSIGLFQKWLANLAEEKGVMVFPGFAGNELLWDENRVTGVRTGDKGVDKDGNPKDNFELGMDLEAAVTIIGEGPRGHLFREICEKLELDEESQPQVYELGCKEVLELPEGSVTEGEVLLTMGWPLDSSTFGGAFIYSLSGDRVCIGMLAGLDAQDPALDVHYLLQKLKTHPRIREKIGKGKVIKYGAKTVTVGGWSSMPKLYAGGALIVGDSASFLNAARIKGIHLAMKSGMLAAETAFDAMISGDSSEEALAAYKTRVDDSWIREEMEPVKNFHAGFAEGGLFGGMAKFGMSKVFGSGKTRDFHADHEGMKQLSHVHADATMPAADEVQYDGTYLVDKLTDVYLSGTQHDEHQPCHLLISDTEICATRCAEEYGNPCERFCPAQVYNMVPNALSGRKEMQVDFSNCVHCKTCDIRDPYQIIQWVPPEGGQGPEYGNL